MKNVILLPDELPRGKLHTRYGYYGLLKKAEMNRESILNIMETAVTGNLEARQTIENDLAFALRESGRTGR